MHRPYDLTHELLVPQLVFKACARNGLKSSTTRMVSKKRWISSIVIRRRLFLVTRNPTDEVPGV
jgi:hypothetical protein